MHFHFPVQDSSPNNNSFHLQQFGSTDSGKELLLFANQLLNQDDTYNRDSKPCFKVLLAHSFTQNKTGVCVCEFFPPKQAMYDFGRFRHGAMAIDVAVRRGIGTIARMYLHKYPIHGRCARITSRSHCNHRKRPVSRRFLNTTLSRSR